MPLNFPSNPGIGDTYGFSDRVWTYGGEGWYLTPRELPQGPQGLQGAQGLDGAFAGQGAQGLQGLQGLQGRQGRQGVQGLQGASNQGTQGTLAGGGGSGTYDTGITTSVYVSVTSGIGINTAQTNDVFLGPGIGYSFPSTPGLEYIIESIHISNTFSNELYLAARHDYNLGVNTWRNVPIAQRVVVPYQGATELLEQPIIASPSDILRFQALTGTGSTATGVDGGLDAFITISAKEDTDYVGVGTTVTTTGGTDQNIFTSTTNPSVLQSIRLINYNLNIDVDARVSIYRGEVRLGYLVFDLTIPKNSTIEILDRPKYLLASDSIRASASNNSALSVCISGKYIVP